jgi:hypothetical protein
MVDFALKYPWQAVILEAFLATPSDLSIKINEAERAISDRVREPEIDFSERMALDDALRMLRVLTSEARLQQVEYKQGEEQKIA